MRFLVLNTILALIWGMLQGRLRPLDFIVGFVLGFVMISLAQRLLGSGNYARKMMLVVRFIALAAWEIFSASLALAWLMIQPKLKLSPAVVALPLDVEGGFEIVLLANLITLSPGTLSVDVSTDQKTLYIHTITITDPDDFREQIKNGLERRVLEVMR